MAGAASDDPIGFYAGWKAYFLATYLLVGVMALFTGWHWSMWIAPATVPLVLFFGVFEIPSSLRALLLWLGMVAIVVAAVHGAGGVVEEWRTPRRAWRPLVVLLLALAAEVWLIHWI